jgi:hypothetical protein
MNPILRFIDWLIRQHCDLLGGLFVYVAVPLAAWYLGPRSGGKAVQGHHTFDLVIWPRAQPTGIPPVIRWEIELPKDGGDPFDGL